MSRRAERSRLTVPVTDCVIGRVIAVRADDDGLRETLESRRALGTGTATLAAERATSESIAALAQTADAMAARMADPDRWLAADRGFRVALAQAAGNRLLALFMDALAEVMRCTRRPLGTRADLRHPRAVLARSVAIPNAVRAGDAVAARAAMAALFDATTTVLPAIGAAPEHLARRSGRCSPASAMRC